MRFGVQPPPKVYPCLNDPITHCPFAESYCFTTRAGFPETTEKGGTLLVTTEFAPTTEFLPITNSPRLQTIAAPNPIQHPCPIRIVPPSVVPCRPMGMVVFSKAWS